MSMIFEKNLIAQVAVAVRVRANTTSTSVPLSRSKTADAVKARRSASSQSTMITAGMFLQPVSPDAACSAWTSKNYLTLRS
jgi:hypothetical protein